MKVINKLNIIGVLAICGLALTTHAQCPQTCDSSDNTAIGSSAGVGFAQNVAVGAMALSPSASEDNVAVGFAAMADASGSFNSAGIGAGAAQFNTGSENTGVGYEALYGVQGSSTGSNNTASGYRALFKDTTGSSNVATGHEALNKNTTGTDNVAVGRTALFNNTTGSDNVAIGRGALNANKTASQNTACGYKALNTSTGANNTAVGYEALFADTFGILNTASGREALFSNTTGSGNSALGDSALLNNTTGLYNIGIGISAGAALSTGGYNIDIGNTGVAGEGNTIRMGTSGNQTNTYIAGINGVTVAGGIGVIIDSNGHLGTSTSSARYKENIQPMDKASDAILSLQPVTFRYKKDLDPKAIPQFGLVAEQVAKVDPHLVACDDQGKPYSVRYEAVNAMLLNEFLKEHRKVEEQSQDIATQKTTIGRLETAMARQRKDFQATTAQQEKEIKALVAGLQKVSNQLELTKPVARVVANDP